MPARCRSLALWALALVLFLPLGALLDDAFVVDATEWREEQERSEVQAELAAVAQAPQLPPVLRSTPQASGERLIICQDGALGHFLFPYTLYLETPTGERLLCRVAGQGSLCFEAQPDTLQWVPETPDTALLHLRKGPISRLLLLRLHRREDASLPHATAQRLLEVQAFARIPRLRLRGQEADWLNEDGSLAASFSLTAPAAATPCPASPRAACGTRKEPGENDADNEDTSSLGLLWASAPNKRGERVGILPHEAENVHDPVALLEPGKEPGLITAPLGCERGHEALEESLEGRQRLLGWVSEDSCYACGLHPRFSSLRLLRLQRSPEGSIQGTTNGITLMYDGLLHAREEGSALLLHTATGALLLRLPLER